MNQNADKLEDAQGVENEQYDVTQMRKLAAKMEKKYLKLLYDKKRIEMEKISCQPNVQLNENPADAMEMSTDTSNSIDTSKLIDTAASIKDNYNHIRKYGQDLQHICHTMITPSYRERQLRRRKFLSEFLT
ncbi:uncharacterized protein LOC113363869 [Ctenocephalides felis]|uniref:uncharacterized protein LOC113363869 n=1 Tax=Ctenocephalides felis TaxID=7515 RepID=UPI000E6E2E7E|nr:uncharacterized protein LOC113363869 [Ctenocephalides felis]